MKIHQTIYIFRYIPAFGKPEEKAIAASASRHQIDEMLGLCQANLEQTSLNLARQIKSIRVDVDRFLHLDHDHQEELNQGLKQNEALVEKCRSEVERFKDAVNLEIDKCVTLNVLGEVLKIKNGNPRCNEETRTIKDVPIFV